MKVFAYIEHKLIHLQAYLWVFIVECFITVWLLMCQGVMADKFLMPCMQKICKNYELSPSIGGVLIAVGVSMPELTATMVSFQSHGVKMTEFGLALVMGGAVFADLCIPAVAYAMNFGCRKKRPDAKFDDPEYKAQN